MPRPSKQDQLDGRETDACGDRIVHLDAVAAARAVMPMRDELGALSTLFSALADPSRLRLVAALGRAELCVCDLAATVGQTESSVSHHLRLLRSLGLVRSRRDGRRVYYALDDDHVSALYGQALDHVRHLLSPTSLTTSGKGTPR